MSVYSWHKVAADKSYSSQVALGACDAPLCKIRQCDRDIYSWDGGPKAKRGGAAVRFTMEQTVPQPLIEFENVRAA